MDKDQILAKFSAEPEKYYKVKLFEEQGFERKSCTKCGRYYWTLDSNKTQCPEDSDDTYSFIGNPPTNKRFDYSKAWNEVETFFVKNGHTSVSRYPVVCRWRDDLYFTIASIVDFQRVMGSKVVFEFPANPIIVPQPCLRFKDLENVGVTGRHFSSFCMIGQLSIPNSQGYWKDECIDLDFRLLTNEFGINKNEIVFVEDVWEGGGSFGSSLEYYVKGLELGNAVFTEFQGELGNHTVLEQKVIDMGAGLERFAWITMGTPTAYDCCFGPITNQLIQKVGIDIDSNLLTRYFIEIAKNQNKFSNLIKVKSNAIKNINLTEEQVARIINPLEGIYLIADHLRTLIFAISDGALPSNVGGGYNLRIVLRRIIGTMQRLELHLDLNEMIDLHIDYLKNTYPELEKRREDVKTIIKVEAKRYEESKIRMQKIASNLKSKKQIPNVSDLIRMYESDGITPDYLKELDVIPEIPPTFYSKLSDLHQSVTTKETQKLPLQNIVETEMLFYGDDPHEFDAKVLDAFDKFVVLDRTSFYARGGGQEPDHGTIAGFDVVDVSKHGGIIVHELKGDIPKKGETVKCVVDSKRRDGITKHHTSTHILNSSARNVLGSWVWQNSAFKEDDHARLDITHHSALTPEEVQKIEDKANSIVKKDLPVTIENYDRGTAEQKYGFRIYQGGVVPVKSVRIVAIEDFDIEACGGTHVKKTREIDLIRIERTKRIQDGVVRLEFKAGQVAREFDKEQENLSSKVSAKLEEKNRIDAERERKKEKWRIEIPILIDKISSELDKGTKKNIIDGINIETNNSGEKIFVYTQDQKYDDANFHIKFGEKLIKKNPKVSYCGIFESDSNINIKAQSENIPNGAEIASKVAEILGGRGGGTGKFGQGGGKDKSKKDEALKIAKSMVLE